MASLRFAHLSVAILLGVALGGAQELARPGRPAESGGVSVWDVIPSATTMTGIATFDARQSATPAIDGVAVDLPGFAPVPLTDAMINFGTVGSGDTDPTCNGNWATPSAPAGHLCLYLRVGGGFSLGSLKGNAGVRATRSIRIVWTSDGVAGAREWMFATWAYTAP